MDAIWEWTKGFLTPREIYGAALHTTIIEIIRYILIYWLFVWVRKMWKSTNKKWLKPMLCGLQVLIGAIALVYLTASIRPQYTDQQAKECAIKIKVTSEPIVFTDGENEGTTILVPLVVSNQGNDTTLQGWRAHIKFSAEKEYSSMVCLPLSKEGNIIFDPSGDNMTYPKKSHLPTALYKNILESGRHVRGWVLFNFPSLPGSYLHSPKSTMIIECFDVWDRKAEYTFSFLSMKDHNSKYAKAKTKTL